jgi:hypothetical protein
MNRLLPRQTLGPCLKTSIAYWATNGVDIMFMTCMSLLRITMEQWSYISDLAGLMKAGLENDYQSIS